MTQFMPDVKGDVRRVHRVLRKKHRVPVALAQGHCRHAFSLPWKNLQMDHGNADGPTQGQEICEANVLLVPKDQFPEAGGVSHR
jgi:hypothetical protein